MAASDPFILLVCLTQAPLTPSEMRRVDSGRAALLALRGRACPLMLVGLDVPDLSPWALVERVRQVRPWQRWGLVAADATAEDERIARCLGAVAVLDRMPPRDQLLELAGMRQSAWIEPPRLSVRVRRRRPVRPVLAWPVGHG